MPWKGFTANTLPLQYLRSQKPDLTQEGRLPARTPLDPSLEESTQSFLGPEFGLGHQVLDIQLIDLCCKDKVV